MHQPGIKPGSEPWQGTILPLDHWCFCFLDSICRQSFHCSEDDAKIPSKHFNYQSVTVGWLYVACTNIYQANRNTYILACAYMDKKLFLHLLVWLIIQQLISQINPTKWKICHENLILWYFLGDFGSNKMLLHSTLFLW